MKNKAKIIAIILIVLGVGLLISVFGKFAAKEIKKEIIINKLPERDKNKEDSKGGTNEEEVQEVEINGQVAPEGFINLSDYSSNVIIGLGGEYTIVGNLYNSLYIDADEPVTLNLNGVNINSSTDSAIANIGTQELIININNVNNVSDGAVESAYDGCIFSKGPLTIKGPGNLIVKGNQKDGEGIATKDSPITISETNITIYSNDDGINSGGKGGTITINSGTMYIEAGGDSIDSNKDVIINGGSIFAYAGLQGINTTIDADDKYTINGGTIIGLGNDSLMLPNVGSKGRVLSFGKIDKISKDQLITLVNEKDDVIFSFTPKMDFNTILYASNDLAYGKYYLYTGGVVNNNKYTKGEKLIIDGRKEYVVNKKATAYIE